MAKKQQTHTGIKPKPPTPVPKQHAAANLLRLAGRRARNQG